jgi:hypothetical protein
VTRTPATLSAILFCGLVAVRKLRDDHCWHKPSGGALDINIDVRVIPETDKSTPGVIDSDVPLEQIRSDIVEDLGLGDPDDWDLAIMPSNMRGALSRYKPGSGDTLILINRTVTRGSSFRRR